MTLFAQIPAEGRWPAVLDDPDSPQVRLGRPGPEARWLSLADTAPLLLTGADRGAHRMLRELLGGWVQLLAETGDVDVVAWSEMDTFLDSAGHAGVSLTPSLDTWLAGLRRAYEQGVPRPTVFVGYEITGTAGADLLSAAAEQPMTGPGWHVIWAAPPDSAKGRLATELPWRTRMEVEPDARHVAWSQPGREPQRLLAVWDKN
jgi:hypothetical protein